MSFQEYLDEEMNSTHARLAKQSFKNWSACGGLVDGEPPAPTPDTKLSKDSPPFVPTPGKCTRDQQTEEEEAVSSDPSTLDGTFVTKLIDYLDKGFSSYGQTDSAIKAELKKTMPVGTEEKMKEVTRVKKKINDVIAREKKRFLDRVSGKVEDIKIKPVEKVEEPETKEKEDNNES